MARSEPDGKRGPLMMRRSTDKATAQKNPSRKYQNGTPPPTKTTSTGQRTGRTKTRISLRRCLTAPSKRSTDTATAVYSTATTKRMKH